MPEGPSIVILKEEAAKFVGKTVRAVSGNSKQDIQRMHGKRVRAICSWGPVNPERPVALNLAMTSP